MKKQQYIRPQAFSVRPNPRGDLLYLEPGDGSETSPLNRWSVVTKESELSKRQTSEPDTWEEEEEEEAPFEFPKDINVWE